MENIKATIDRVRYMSLDHVSPPEMLLASIMIFF
ncbi:GntR family transcriptional regulator, partial [Cronobacter sakazakii E899]